MISYCTVTVFSMLQYTLVTLELLATLFSPPLPPLAVINSLCMIEVHGTCTMIRLTHNIIMCHVLSTMNILVKMCITTKMAITIGLLILFSFTRLPCGHGQAPNRPEPSESSTAYVCMQYNLLNEM